MMRANRMMLLGLVAAGAFAACAAGAASPPVGTVGSVAGARQEPLIPPGHGTLKQDEVTVSLRSGPLLVKVTPLSEHVIRLTAPDTYTRLHGLVESRREELASATFGTPEIFLVSFFSYQPNVAFEPEDLQLLNQGRLLRPVAVLPVTTGWGQQLLQQQDNQTALYAFDGPIDYEQPFTVRYDMVDSEAWRNMIPRLRAERNRVQSRVGEGDSR